jgi:ubiquinone/menaquinone biosynthesis C-methylase UbiE
VSATSARPSKAYRGMAMEGWIARWYARNTAKSMAEFRAAAQGVAAQLSPGSRVLEVAPGPGYLAIELAKLGSYRIVGLDISESFVRIAGENAAKAGVDVAFRHGDAAAMPFDANSFDFIVCRAAFKNFSAPVQALAEMHRVLAPGGKAVVIDMRSDASNEALDAHVSGMGLGWFNALMTRWIFKHSLVKRAYSPAQFRQMASQTPFGTCEIREDPIGMTVTLVK